MNHYEDQGFPKWAISPLRAIYGAKGAKTSTKIPAKGGNFVDKFGKPCFSFTWIKE